MVGSHNPNPLDHGGCARFVSARVLADGGLDSGWGEQGVTAGSPECMSAADASLSAGALLIAGNPFRYFDPQPEFAVARYLADGTVDPGFGTGGFRVEGFRDPDPATATSIAALPDGGAIVAGLDAAPECALGPTSAEGGRECTALALKAYLADGSVDRSFGDDGLVTIPRIRPCRTLDQVTCEPALSRKKLRRLVRSGIGSSVSTWGSQMRLKLSCPYRLQSRCAFQLELRTGRRAPVMGKLARRVNPGATETARVKVKPGQRVKLVRSGAAVLTGKVETQQRTLPIVVRRPVKRQPAP
jgi:hypothetical protein